MEILEFDNLNKKESGLHYRNDYEGALRCQFKGNEKSTHLSFVIERDALGNLLISLVFKDQIDYPLLPFQRLVRDFIVKLDSEGGLP